VKREKSVREKKHNRGSLMLIIKIMKTLKWCCV